MGDAKSRRTLKRQLDKIVSDKDHLLNSKVRRKIKRTLDILHPKEGTGAKEEQIELKEGEENDSDTKKKNKRKLEEKVAQKKPPTFTVFIGQLHYTTKAEDVKKFLKGQGVEGEINVRLLTEKDTGKSKGMCFVSVDNSNDYGRCLELHMSELHGRFINIEKSN
jgi:RNA recognition motif-containing protein